MLLLALVLCAAAAPASANEIKGLRLDTGSTGTRAEILLDAPVEYSLLTLSAPDRLVVDLRGASVAKHLPLPAAGGVVRNVRTGHPVPGTTRVVFDLAAPVAVLRPRLEPTLDGQRLVLEWPGDGAPDEASVAAAILNGGAPPSAPATAGTADPAAASAAATARLIAQLPKATQPAVPAARPPTAAVRVPTTIATGVPAPVATTTPTWW